jgi:DNA modification methylase/ParB-like chromosome segregation protein Spo0J
MSNQLNAKGVVAVRYLHPNNMTDHPEAYRVPEARPQEYAEILADVTERGVRVPIELQPGTAVVLDGRTRRRAAKEAGLDRVPVIDAPLKPGEDPVVYMMRAATKRRHLTDDQRAMLAEEERAWLAKQGKKRRAESAQAQGGRGKEGGRGHKKPLGDAATPKGSGGERSRTRAARNNNVSERKVKQAQKVKRHDPELAEQVKNGQVPLRVAVREVEREEKRQRLEEKATAAPPLNKDSCRIITGDCLVQLPRLKAAGLRFRLIVPDPPYNQGVNYGKGKKADLLPPDQYLSWCREWMALCADLLTDDGSMWVIISDEWQAGFRRLLREVGLHLHQAIVWYETFGQNNTQETGFNRCHRHLLWAVKNPKDFVFNADAVRRPSDRQEKYQDPRADPDGKVWDSVWGVNPPIPRLTGTCEERLPDFPTQLPLALLRPIIACASAPGDRVLDPFCGSATAGVVCLEQGQLFTGIEESAKFAGLARQRLRVEAARLAKPEAQRADR